MTASGTFLHTLNTPPECAAPSHWPTRTRDTVPSASFLYDSDTHQNTREHLSYPVGKSPNAAVQPFGDEQPNGRDNSRRSLTAHLGAASKCEAAVVGSDASLFLPSRPDGVPSLTPPAERPGDGIPSSTFLPENPTVGSRPEHLLFCRRWSCTRRQREWRLLVMRRREGQLFCVRSPPRRPLTPVTYIELSSGPFLCTDGVSSYLSLRGLTVVPANLRHDTAFWGPGGGSALRSASGCRGPSILFRTLRRPERHVPGSRTLAAIPEIHETTRLWFCGQPL